MKNHESRDDIEQCKEELAASEHVTVTELQQLALDSSEAVRVKVAENPNTPMSLLDDLCNDSSRKVRITSKMRLLQCLSQRFV